MATQPSAAAAAAAAPALSQAAASKVQQAFSAHGCAECTEAARLVNAIAAASPAAATLLNGVLPTVSLAVATNAETGFNAGAITISHGALRQGAHDKSLADRMADSVIFESLNASKAAAYAANNQAFAGSGDIRNHGFRTADIETDIMVDFIAIARNLPDGIRTGNMARALIRDVEAGAAGVTVKQHLMDLPHEEEAARNDPRNYMGLPTRLLYIYEDVEKSTPLKIQCAVLRKANIAFALQQRPNVLKKMVDTIVLNAPDPLVSQLLERVGKSWPGGSGARRPNFFLAFLREVETDQKWARFSGAINRAAFGFDAPEIQNMAEQRKNIA